MAHVSDQNLGCVAHPAQTRGGSLHVPVRRSPHAHGLRESGGCAPGGSRILDFCGVPEFTAQFLEGIGGEEERRAVAFSQAGIARPEGDRPADRIARLPAPAADGAHGNVQAQLDRLVCAGCVGVANVAA